jgi:hypothetical protein
VFGSQKLSPFVPNSGYGRELTVTVTDNAGSILGKIYEQMEEQEKKVSASVVSLGASAPSIDNVCDSEGMTTVTTWAQQHFAKEFLGSSTHSVDTVNNLYASIQVHIEKVTKYQTELSLYTPKVFLEYGVYFLLVRINTMVHFLSMGMDEKIVVPGYSFNAEGAEKKTQVFIELLKESIFAVEALKKTAIAFMGDLQVLRTALPDYMAADALKAKISQTAEVKNYHIFMNGIGACLLIQKITVNALTGKGGAGGSKTDVKLKMKEKYQDFLAEFYNDFAKVYFKPLGDDGKLSPTDAWIDFYPTGCAPKGSTDPNADHRDLISSVKVPGLQISTVLKEQKVLYFSYFSQTYFASFNSIKEENRRVFDFDRFISHGPRQADINLAYFEAWGKVNYSFHYKFLLDIATSKKENEIETELYDMTYRAYGYFRTSAGTSNLMTGAKFDAEAKVIYAHLMRKCSENAIVLALVNEGYINAITMAENWATWMYFLCEKSGLGTECATTDNDIKKIDTTYTTTVRWEIRITRLTTIVVKILTEWLKKVRDTALMETIAGEMELIGFSSSFAKCPPPYSRDCLHIDKKWDAWFVKWETYMKGTGDIKGFLVSGINLWYQYKTTGKTGVDTKITKVTVKVNGKDVDITKETDQTKWAFFEMVIKGVWMQLIIVKWKEQQEKKWTHADYLFEDIKKRLEIVVTAPSVSTQKAMYNMLYRLAISYTYFNGYMAAPTTAPANTFVITGPTRKSSFESKISFDNDDHFEMFLAAVTYNLLSPYNFDANVNDVSAIGFSKEKNLVIKRNVMIILNYFARVYREKSLSAVIARIMKVQPVEMPLTDSPKQRKLYLDYFGFSASPTTNSGPTNFRQVMYVLFAQSFETFTPVYTKYELISSNFNSLDAQFQNPMFIHLNMFNLLYQSFVIRYTGDKNQAPTLAWSQLHFCIEKTASTLELDDATKLICPNSYRKYAEMYYFVHLGTLETSLRTIKKGGVVTKIATLEDLRFHEGSKVMMHQRFFIMHIFKNQERQSLYKGMCKDNKVHYFCVTLNLFSTMHRDIESGADPAQRSSVFDQMADDMGLTATSGMTLTQRFTLIASIEILENFLSSGTNGRQDLLNDMFYFRSVFLTAEDKKAKKEPHRFEKYFVNSLPKDIKSSDTKKEGEYDAGLAREFVQTYLRLAYGKGGVGDDIEQPAFWAVEGIFSTETWKSISLAGKQERFFALKYLLMYSRNSNQYTQIADKFMGQDVFLAIPKITQRGLDPMVGILINYVLCAKWSQPLKFVDGSFEGQCGEFEKEFKSDNSATYVTRLAEILHVLFIDGAVNSVASVEQLFHEDGRGLHTTPQEISIKDDAEETGLVIAQKIEVSVQQVNKEITNSVVKFKPKSKSTVTLQTQTITTQSFEYEDLELPEELQNLAEERLQDADIQKQLTALAAKQGKLQTITTTTNGSMSIRQSTEKLAEMNQLQNEGSTSKIRRRNLGAMRAGMVTRVSL